MHSDKRKVAKVLNALGGDEAKKVLNNIAATDAKLAQQIKDLIFVYEDIFELPQKDLQLLLQKVDGDDLALALKATGAALGAYMISGLSDRRKKIVLEQMKLLGKIKRSDAQAAKMRIADMARQMVDRGEISIADEWVE